MLLLEMVHLILEPKSAFSIGLAPLSLVGIKQILNNLYQKLRSRVHEAYMYVFSFPTLTVI